MIEVLVSGVVFDTASDELTARAMKAALEGIGWKNVTTQRLLRRTSGGKACRHNLTKR
jgi:hypothetical protein